MPPDVDDPRLDEVRSPSLCDAMREVHAHRAHVLDLVTPTPGRRVFGTAATMLFAPLREDVDREGAFGFTTKLEEALGGDGAGKVVVMSVHGNDDAAVVGGIRLAHLERHGVAGMVTNARMRDFHEAQERSFACYARGETVYAGSAEIMCVAADLPVALGAATVLPGDHVYADDAGVVVIPAAALDRVLDLAVEIEKKDGERFERALGT